MRSVLLLVMQNCSFRHVPGWRIAVALLLTAGAAPSLAETPTAVPPQYGEWQPLFNGKELSGWSVACPTDERAKEYWRVVDGAIECNSLDDGEHDYNWLIAEGEFDDFQLRLKFQIFSAHRGNSGVQFRSRFDRNWQPAGGAWLHGPQVDIHPPNPLRAGLIYDETWETRRWIHPSLPNARLLDDQAPSEARDTKLLCADNDTDVWNDLELTCVGTHVKTVVNGNLVSDFDGEGILNDAAHARHRVGMRGHFALQLHRGDKTRIRFKDIEVRQELQLVAP